MRRMLHNVYASTVYTSLSALAHGRKALEFVLEGVR